MPFEPVVRRKSLTSKLLVLTVIWLVFAILSIGYTLALSWKLEGGAAAINDAGSLRMKTYRMAYLVSIKAPNERVMKEATDFENTLSNLRKGDPARPLFLPNNKKVNLQAALIADKWAKEIQPLILNTDQNPALFINANAEVIKGFVSEINQLVKLVEADNALNTTLLRLFQSVLLVMALVGSVVMVYLLFLLIIRPVNHLSIAIGKMSQGDFGARVEVESEDEFGMLGQGFNQMAEHLQSLYRTLEDKVQQKTQAFEDKNKELQILYESSSFLHQSHNLHGMCEGFLQRIIKLFGAQAGSVRLVDFERGQLDEVAQVNLPQNLQEARICAQVEACFCGQAVTQEGSVIKFFKDKGEINPTLCQQAGFSNVSILHIRYNTKNLGIFSLYFKDERQLSEQEQFLLETLGSHLGVAIENIRLAAKNEQLAVLEERNFMAQGLHDSIAQSLTFLNLQVQMLESALKNAEEAQVQENIGFIREGVQECYEDVRELLLNFRIRESQEEFPDAVRTLIKRFESQTQIGTELVIEGQGLPLNPQQQLQMTFIVQEALSNVRKHAQASVVKIIISDEKDFTLTISDDGRGFDRTAQVSLNSTHVGLAIMQERAGRIHAKLRIDSKAQQGTTIAVVLPKEERIAS